MSYRPTIINGSWFDPDGMMRLDEPVEIHVNRIGRMGSGKRVFLAFSEPRASRTAHTEVVVRRHEFDLILTSDPELLLVCPNARLFVFGDTWVFSQTDPARKGFRVSTLVGAKCALPGHRLRHEVWARQAEIHIPKIFYRSARGGPLLHPGNLVFPSHKGITPSDKAELFAGAEFNIAIENSREGVYLTEKLIDCFVTRTVPVYWGAPQVGDFFNLDGMFVVDNTDAVIRACNSLTPETYSEMSEAVEDNFNRAKPLCAPVWRRVQEAINAHLRAHS